VRRARFNINKGIAKLRKYFPKQGISQNNKALYLALILDPRIKREGLEAIGLTRGESIDMYNRLYTDFQV
jgi:hypothetical protein